MAQQLSTGPAAHCRRLLAADLPALSQIFSQQLAPHARFTDFELRQAAKVGALLGVFCGSQLQTAALVLPSSARCTPATELRPLCTVLGISDNQCLFWVGPGQACSGPLISFARAMAARQNLPDQLCCAIPAKGGRLNAFFHAGLCLKAVRPLWRLTPCYLLTEDRPSATKTSRQLPLSDTLAVSRALEEGWVGTGLQEENLVLEKSCI